MLHSDQGTQYTSDDWQSFLKDHGIVCSMSRRGNCHDNAVIEDFHQLIKRERIRRKVYLTRAVARSDVFDYIELFYNPKRRHGSAGDQSPVEFERRAGISGREVSMKSGAIHRAWPGKTRMHENAVVQAHMKASGERSL